MKRYDIIVAGGGMAGLSLCFYLSRSALREQSILLIDREAKNHNDRTWCFWESGAGPFESILFRTWQTIDFLSSAGTHSLPMGQYEYKMLRGIDFYRFIQQELAKLPNLDVHYASIDSISDTPTGGIVRAAGDVFVANYVFDSVTGPPPVRPENHRLLQHFRGWVITAERECFSPQRPRFMDFRVSQQHECRFFYVLPFNKHTALVEYTVFGQHLLPEQAYTEALRNYIDEFLNTGPYRIEEIESGIIPMSDQPADEPPGNHVIRIGTAGGYTKPSTGYTFQRTQRYLRELVRHLSQPTLKKSAPVGWLKRFLDTVFLNVLIHNRHPADDIFARLFTRNPTSLVFRFMDEDTTVGEDLRIINSLPKLPFARAAIDSLLKKVRYWLGPVFRMPDSRNLPAPAIGNPRPRRESQVEKRPH